MRTEVYSWRVSVDLKNSLAREAKRRRTSLSAVLDRAAREWLDSNDAEENDERAQLVLQKAASKCFGTLASGDPHRSENVRKIVRDRLLARYER